MEMVHSMHYRQTVCLTSKELAGYRQWLAELDEEAHAPGGQLHEIDSELRSVFRPKGPVGKQIYRSYTDEELLDILIRTMNHHGHKPRFEEVYGIYLDYLRQRFGNLSTAKELARRRMRRLRLMEKWPADWPERVSAEGLLKSENRQTKEFSTEERALLLRLCETAGETGYPPVLTPDEIQIFNRHGGWIRVLEAMGIPALKDADARYMARYWAEQRGEENPADDSAAEKM